MANELERPRIYVEAADATSRQQINPLLAGALFELSVRLNLPLATLLDCGITLLLLQEGGAKAAVQAAELKR